MHNPVVLAARSGNKSIQARGYTIAKTTNVSLLQDGLSFFRLTMLGNPRYHASAGQSRAP